MDSSIIALFGEAQKGELLKGYYCEKLDELFDYFGEPPPQTQGLFFAVRTLLYHHALIYFRVNQEGFSDEDYLECLNLLNNSLEKDFRLEALFLPGVGSKKLIERGGLLCRCHKSLFIMNEQDFYDFVTDQ